MVGIFLFISLILGVVLISIIFMSRPDNGNSPSSSEDDTVPDLKAIDDPDELIELGEKYESRQEWSNAEQCWSRLIELDPDRSDAYYRLGLVELMRENYQRASESFDHVIQIEDEPSPEIFLHSARASKAIDRNETALYYYTEYLENGSPDPDEIKEIADLARELEKWGQARKHYETLKETGSDRLAVEATIAMAEMSLQRNLADRLESIMDDLESMFEDGYLSDRQRLDYWYLKAKTLEINEKLEEANRFYRKIYQENADYRDIKKIVESEISNLDSDDVVKKFNHMDEENFEDLCSRIVEGMGYEVIEIKRINPEELDIVAREKAMTLRVKSLLFTFKQWTETAGELAIKEFEFKIVEDRYEQGYFINPAGFNDAAEEYADGNEKMYLIGPGKVLEYLGDWYRNPSDS